MNYVKIEDGKVARYPYMLAHLRTDNPQISFPRAFAGWEAEYGVYPIALTDRPAPSDPLTKDVIEADPVLVDGQWTQTWTEQDADPVEATTRKMKAASARPRAFSQFAKAVGWTPACSAICARVSRQMAISAWMMSRAFAALGSFRSRSASSSQVAIGSKRAVPSSRLGCGPGRRGEGAGRGRTRPRRPLCAGKASRHPRPHWTKHDEKSRPVERRYTLALTGHQWHFLAPRRFSSVERGTPCTSASTPA